MRGVVDPLHPALWRTYLAWRFNGITGESVNGERPEKVTVEGYKQLLNCFYQ